MLKRVHKIAPVPKDGAHEDNLQAAARALPAHEHSPELARLADKIE
jgi:hypothetical protein